MLLMSAPRYPYPAPTTEELRDSERPRYHNDCGSIDKLKFGEGYTRIYQATL